MRTSRVVKIGDVLMGGENSIIIQSMTNTPTNDAKKTIEQIKKLEKAGCEMVRVTVNSKEAAESIKEIKENGNYTVYSEGKYWDCISDEKLEVGERVYVEKIEGNKLVLKKIKRKK